MPLDPYEVVVFGGVDSRSNPINMPVDRALRVFNWAPKQDGHMELRWGYTAESMSVVNNAPIHSLFAFQTWDALKKYLVVAQGTGLSLHDLAANTDAPATIRGAAIASANKWNAYFANNRIHLGNGTDQKFFDGAVFRDNGLRVPTAAEVANVMVNEGVRELTPAENTAITLTPAAGGSFPATTGAGVLLYVVLFDTATNELGAATLNAAAGRITLALNNKITVGVMPTPPAAWVKLLAGTLDGQSNAFFYTNTSSAVVSSLRSPGGTTSTIIATGHGLASGDIVILAGTTSFDGVFSITVIDANTFSFLNPAGWNNAPGASSTSGTVKRIVKAPNATASLDILAPTQDTSYIVNQNVGLAASVIGGVNPGYQFYICIYNPVTQHVGNRILVGSRFAQTTYRTNVRLTNLPNYLSTDSEWQVLIGRTGDGAQVPYVITDAAGNFAVAYSGQTSTTITQGLIDGRYEMPTRNGIIPAVCTMFARVSDKCYAADPKSPTIRVSGSQADVNKAVVLGCAEQSWAPNDIETFPTAQPVTGIAENDLELFCGTLRHTAILSDQNGLLVWKGPWNGGLAGPRAMVKAQPYGFFWLSGDKQLCTFVYGLPTPVSEEYELAELAQIGDAYLNGVELSYYRDPSKNKDEIRIEGRKADGSPYTIIHDFKLRDGRSQMGQGYSSQFQSDLSIAFTHTMGQDANGKPQIYAGASNGHIHRLYSGANDNGIEYSADAIYLVTVGPSRPDIPFLDWYGDQNIVVSISKVLNTSLTAGQNQFEAISSGGSDAVGVPGYDNDSLWRATLSAPEIQGHAYLRFQLTSHSVDGSLALNAPPHLPLEAYGRIYEVVPIMGQARGV